jgi:hypothetical protein
MVNKTKRINKKGYLKSLQKRKSRRRMYGGKLDVKQDMEINQVSNNEPLDKSTEIMMNKIEKENKIEFPSIGEIPVVGPIVEKSGDLIEGAAVKALDVAGNAIGVDINNPESVGEKLDDIKQAISSPENIKKTKEILANAGAYGELLVEAAAPVIEQTANKILPIVTKEADKAITAGLGTAVNVAEDVLGPFIGIPRTLVSATEAFNATVNASSELVKGMAEGIQGTQENFNRLVEEKMPKMPKVPEMPNMSPGSFKTYNKQAQMIGGRVIQSQSEFLSPSVNRSQIIQQYGGKWHTKRRNRFRSRMSSRRR